MPKEQERARLIKNYQEWRATHAEGLDGVHEALEVGDFIKACHIMQAVVQHAAQVAVAMQSIMVRAAKGESLEDE